MKRLQVILPDEVYESLKKEAVRRQTTVADIVRRGIDRLLASSVQAPYRTPVINPRDLGVPNLPDGNWRDIANER
jgi:CopG-like RHH_1 or ribbon-helix-helix domain, RHH_5